MNTIDQLLSHLPEIQTHLGYHFKNQPLLIQAFVHRSFYNEHRDVVAQHNERLEFLGDSVLGLLISEYLYLMMPNEPEGLLSHYRSYIVEASNCAVFLQHLGLAPYVLLGKGERLNDGRGRESILADLFEALIGAIYLDSSYEDCKKFFFHHFAENLQKILETPLRNWKAELQDYAQKKTQKTPLYKVVKESGPEHSKIFHVVAIIGEEEVGQGEGNSKKQAEQAAAEDSLRRFGLVT